MIFRGGGGIFYDRPEGNTVFSIPGNPPIATSVDLRNGQLQNLNPQSSFLPGPGMTIVPVRRESTCVGSVGVGIQKTLPWASVVDVSYVGNHGYNRLGASERQPGQPERDSTSGRPTCRRTRTRPSVRRPCRAKAPTRPICCAPTAVWATSTQQLTEFHDTYHSIQSNFNRRFRNGFSFGANYTLSLSFTGNTGLTKRLQHNADGSILDARGSGGVRRAEQAAEPPAAPAQGPTGCGACRKSRPSSAAMKVVGAVINDWQLSGLFSRHVR
jgi:hypothetical protein